MEILYFLLKIRIIIEKMVKYSSFCVALDYLLNLNDLGQNCLTLFLGENIEKNATSISF